MNKLTHYLYLILLIAACEQPIQEVAVVKAGLPVASPEEAGLNPDSLNLLEPYVQQFIDSSYIAGE